MRPSFVRHTTCTLACLLGLAGCTDFPALDGTISPALQNAPYPDLVPLSPIVAQAGAADYGGASAAADLAPRLAALRARAAGLRGPVIPAPTRSRMLRGLR